MWLLVDGCTSSESVRQLNAIRKEEYQRSDDSTEKKNRISYVCALLLGVVSKGGDLTISLLELKLLCRQFVV